MYSPRKIHSAANSKQILQFESTVADTLHFRKISRSNMDQQFRQATFFDGAIKFFTMGIWSWLLKYEEYNDNQRVCTAHWVTQRSEYSR